MIRRKGMAPNTYFAHLAAAKACGITPPRITQVLGNAPASKGFHKRDGYLTIKGKREAYCAAYDGSVEQFYTSGKLNAALLKRFLLELARRGVVAWFRDWDGNEHFHAIDVSLKMKPELARQVRDFLADRDGLAGHQPETFFTAPKEVDDLLRAAFQEANPQ